MNTQEFKVGDLAYFSNGRYGRINVFAGTVTKITATGQVSVTLKSNKVMRFKANGHEIGMYAYDGAMLIDHERYVSSLARMKQEQRVSAVHAARKEFENVVVLSTNKTELLAKIDALRDAVEAL